MNFHLIVLFFEKYSSFSHHTNLNRDISNYSSHLQYTVTQCTTHTPYRSQYAAIALCNF